jgi:uncharacterized coiled-coil protein SlyX
MPSPGFLIAPEIRDCSMSLLGKILAVLNVLAAGAFLYLAALDWGKRQAWSHAVLRHELVLHGLPIDEGAEAPPGMPPSLHAANLGDETLKEAFRNADGPPVRTQLKEVQRKRDEVLRELEARDEATRRKEAGNLLLTLARTGSERSAIARRLVDPNVPTPAIVEDLKKRFDEVTNPNRPEPNASQPRDLEERRAAIAALLYGLSPDPKWHDRVLVVVGVNTYTSEAERQAQVLESMIQEDRLAQANDRTDFEIAYSKMVQRLHGLDTDVRYQNAVIKDLMAQKQKQETLVTTRQSDLKEYEDKLKDLRDEYAAVLAEQVKLQNLVFQAQRHLATASDENLKLERKLRYLELGR